ncbi:hypothetical protein HDU79_005267 [Rhizoclosmatium sp. JEL0117]|nr:hypothetical protein HDU79_005267 [Rhizoclosmatium sp. JEL0117]
MNDETEFSDVESNATSESSGEVEYYDDADDLEIFGSESCDSDDNDEITMAPAKLYTIHSVQELREQHQTKNELEALNVYEPSDEHLQCLACNHDGTQPNNEVFALQCGHAMCKGFWSHYLWLKVHCEKSTAIKCPITPCTQTISPTTVSRLSDKSTAEKYASLQFEEQSLKSASVTQCPAPGCSNVITWNNMAMLNDQSFIPLVTCSCDHSFCFSCGIPNHEPAPCAITSSWISKVREYQSVAWIAANTRNCPKCSISIERDGILINMTCPKCHHAFCWSCLKPVDESHWSCYMSDSHIPAIPYIFPKNDFIEGFIRFDEPEQRQIPAEIEHDLQITRETLKWSYCLQFHLDNNPEHDLFLFSLAELREEVDSLSKYLKNESIDVLVQKVGLVTKKRKALLEAVQKVSRGKRYVLSS